MTDSKFTPNQNLNPIQRLDLIMSNNPTTLVLRRTKINEIWIYDDRGFDLYPLGKLVATIDDIVFIYPLETELFRIHNAFGLLSELLNCKEFQFERMYFNYKGKGYGTTRTQFLTHGIKEEFDFGDKIFLPLKYFRIHDPEAPTFL